MKKSSTSSHSSENSREGLPIKAPKKLVTFQFNQLDCFKSALSSQKPIKITPIAQPKQTSRLQTQQKQPVQEKQDRRKGFSQLRIQRRNRGKITSYAKPIFNSALLLDYQHNQDSGKESNEKSRQKQQFSKNYQENEMVTNVVNSCMRVITQDTEHSSNPISARYSERAFTQPIDNPWAINHNYSNSSIPIMMHNMDAYLYYPKVPMRNKKSISLQESKNYVIDINNIEADGKTTIMMRNIPNKYTQEMLLRTIQRNHKKKFDFFYLPLDFNNNCNVGYAFINFIHTKFIKDFYKEFHNYKWEKFNSMKVCQVCYARIQGTAQLEIHFENSNVIQQKDKRFRPLIGKSLTGNVQSLVNKQRTGDEQYQQQ